MNKNLKNEIYESEDYTESLLHSAFDLLDAMLTGVVLAVIIFSFILMRNSVSGTSMIPTLYDKDELLISRLFYTPKKGDVVIVKDPMEPEKNLVKRVIATEGDSFKIDFENNLVYVNGEVLNEPYIKEHIMLTKADWDIPEVIPNGNIFVMGDNRNYSRDSRSNLVKLIKNENVLGKVLCIIWPFNRMKLL